jgi:hypothetical protein
MVTPLDPKSPLAEAERAELTAVVEALGKWPRLSHLLQYMGEKLISGDVEQLNEYNIATEVLGRSKTVFNAGEDAIARVETHRLRKRLASFYETEGRGHSIQVALPTGSYVPVFIRKPESVPSTASPEHSPAAESGPDHAVGHAVPWFIRRWISLVLLTFLGLAGWGAYLHFHAKASSAGANSGINPPPAASASALPEPQASTAAIRLLAGYSGPSRTDSGGRVWNPDQYFSGGGSWMRSSGFMARTSDQFIFEHSRTGDFTYSIPLKPGSYELHLYFSTPVRSIDALSTFNAWINDAWVLQGFDINADALGEDIADERVFRDVSPGKDGLLHIKFAGATGPATLNAIEVLPMVHHVQRPIRLIMQATPLTDNKGQTWYPDNYFMNGHLSNQMRPLVGSPDPDLFSDERYGHFTYAIPVDSRASYTLVLHFVEFYFTAPASGSNGRIFKVMCNGQTLLDNFDVFREGGSLHEVTKTFHHLKPTAQGKLNLTFEPIVNNATVSGIEVLDESS